MQYLNDHDAHDYTQQPFVKIHGYRKGNDTCNGIRTQDHEGAKIVQGVQR